MEVKHVQIRKLRFSEYNPRALTEKEFNDLKESLLRFGFVEPIVVNSAPGRENVIIGGHQRVRVAEKIGIREIPVVYVNIPDLKKEQELNLRLNKNLGHWDYDLLANFDENLLLDVGFETEELDEIFGLDIDDEFDVEKELEKILKDGARRVKDGDIWQLGEHKLIIGDATKQENWKKVLGNERFDFLFTDPPYKLAYTQRARKIKTKDGMKLKKDKIYESVGKTDSKGRFKGWVKTKKGFGYRAQRSYLGVEKKGGVPEYNEWLSIANEFQNPKGANIMIFENWRNTVPLWQAIEKYWQIRNMIIWWLPNRHQGYFTGHRFYNKYDIAPLAGDGVLNEEYEQELDDYLKEKGQKLLDTYEIILYGKQGASEWYGLVKNGKEKWERGKYQRLVKGTRWAKVSDHITWTAESESSSGQNIIFGTKPIQILVPYIKILSPRTGIVMDCFAGSGPTIIACEIMKRKCRAIEIEPIYGEVILARFERFTGQKAVKIEGS
jgi:DNA modification methylase